MALTPLTSYYKTLLLLSALYALPSICTAHSPAFGTKTSSTQKAYTCGEKATTKTNSPPNCSSNTATGSARSCT